MPNAISLNRSLRTRVAEAVNAPFRHLSTLMISAFCFLLILCPTLCAPQEGKLTIDKLYDGIVDVICKLVFYAGGLVTIGASVALFFAYKDNDSNAMERAVRFLIVGFCCLGFRGLVGLVGVV